MENDKSTIDELIRIEAYFIFKIREREEIAGTEVGDWLQAEGVVRRGLVDDVISEQVRGKLEGGY